MHSSEALHEYESKQHEEFYSSSHRLHHYLPEHYTRTLSTPSPCPRIPLGTSDPEEGGGTQNPARERERRRYSKSSKREREEVLKIQQETERRRYSKSSKRERERRTYSKSSKREREGGTQNPATSSKAEETDAPGTVSRAVSYALVQTLCWRKRDGGGEFRLLETYTRWIHPKEPQARENQRMAASVTDLRDGTGEREIREMFE